MERLMNIIICFGIPFVLLLFVKDVYIKPISKLKKVKQYLLFEKTVIKRTTPVPIKQTSVLVCLYIFLWLNLTFGYSFFWNDGGAAVELVLWLAFNVILRAICELFLVVIPNYKYKKQTGMSAQNVQPVYAGAEVVPKTAGVATNVGENGGFCFCGECGTRYAEDTAFCPNCGCKNMQHIVIETDEGRTKENV